MQLSLGPYRLQAHPVIFTVALALFGLMMSLGFWQIDRGNYKRQLASSMLQSQMDQAQSLRLDTEPPHGAHTPRVKLQGDLAVDRLLLLDGQSHQRVPGYHIWTPVRLDAGWVIVNQGWVAQGASRDILPELEIDAGQTVFEGFWRPLPKAGLRLGDNDCQAGQWPRVVQYPNRAELACLLGGPVANGVVLLAPSAPGNYPRQWTAPQAIPPQRHYGYAVQWFALSATLVFLLIKFSLKRTSNDSPS